MRRAHGPATARLPGTARRAGRPWIRGVRGASVPAFGSVVLPRAVCCRRVAGYVPCRIVWGYVLLQNSVGCVLQNSADYAVEQGECRTGTVEGRVEGTQVIRMYARYLLASTACRIRLEVVRGRMLTRRVHAQVVPV